MLSAIGDAVHVLPVANALKRAWPKTRITWIIQPGPYALVQGHPAVDEFVVFDRKRGPAAARSFLRLRRDLKGRDFDLVLGLQVYFKAGLITALVPGRIKLGFDRGRAQDAQWLFTNRRIPAGPPRHVQDQYFEFLRFLGVDPDPVTWNISFGEAERRAQSAFFSAVGAPTCAMVIGTSKREKNWHPEGYVAVAEAVTQRYGLVPIIVGGPSAAEAEMAEQIMSRAAVEVRCELGDDLRRLAWLIDGSTLVISPDTGPMHIAHALGKPVVALFGYTNPKRYGPYRASEELIVDGYAEFPGEDYPPSRAYRDGMRRVSAEAVLAKVAIVMERYSKGESRDR